MANLKFTLKRKTGETTYDKLFPKTLMSQILVFENDAVTIGDWLNEEYIKKNQIGVVNGVAPLNELGRVGYEHLPQGIKEGLNYYGWIDQEEPDLDIAIQTNIDFSSEPPYNGSFLIINETGEYTFTDTQILDGATSDLFVTSPITLEQGDWLIFQKLPAGDTWLVVNNQHGVASSSIAGIVKLSNKTKTTSMSGDFVITENILKGLLGTGAGQIAKGDHNHDQKYQPLNDNLSKLGSINYANNSFIIGNGTTWVGKTGAEARTALGLKALAIKEKIDNNDWLSTGDALSITHGGTGAKDKTAAQTNLGLNIGTDVQAYHTNLQTISGYTAQNMIDLKYIADNTESVFSNIDTNSINIGKLRNVVDANGSDIGVLQGKPVILYNSTTNSKTGDYIIELDA